MPGRPGKKEMKKLKEIGKKRPKKMLLLFKKEEIIILANRFPYFAGDSAAGEGGAKN